MNILNEIAEYAAYRVLLDKREYSLEELKERCDEAKQLDAAAKAKVKAAAAAGSGDALSSVAKTEKKGILEFLKAGFARDESRMDSVADSSRTDSAFGSRNGIKGVGTSLCFEEPDEFGFYRFGKALKKPGISVISEIKKASPSKGIIAEDFPYLDIAGAYERAGADCISCLTEPKWFMGSDDIFAEVRAYTKLPMIRKDFVVDEYQIYQAKLLGADAVLLICALLDTETIGYYLDICNKLGMDALVETHDEQEIKSALSAGAKLIGVNNRNLKDFSVDFSNAIRLRELIPSDKVYVAESGVKTANDAETIAKTGADAVLIGEALMRSDDKEGFINAFKKAAVSN